jgi:hypothetical protein
MTECLAVLTSPDTFETDVFLPGERATVHSCLVAISHERFASVW